MTGSDIDQTQYRKLTTLIYNAALDQTRWGAFLDQFSSLTNGSHTHLMGFDIKSNMSIDLEFAGYDPDAIAAYNAHYGELNVWADGYGTATVGTPVTTSDLCPHDRTLQSEFFNDWLKPQGNIIEGCGTILHREQDRLFIFGANLRERDVDRHMSPLMNTITSLSPHLQQAFEINRALSGRTFEALATRQAAGVQGAAIVILNSAGRMIFANDVALAQIESGTMLFQKSSGEVSFRGAMPAAALTVAVKAMEHKKDQIAATFMARMEGSGQRHVCRTALFCPDDIEEFAFGRTIGFSGVGLLLTIEPVSETQDITAELRKLYRLTQAEAEIVASFAKGHSLRAIADMRANSIHTVRNQIKSAMHKTGVRRQTDLIRLISSL